MEPPHKETTYQSQNKLYQKIQIQQQNHIENNSIFFSNKKKQKVPQNMNFLSLLRTPKYLDQQNPPQNQQLTQNLPEKSFKNEQKKLNLNKIPKILIQNNQSQTSRQQKNQQKHYYYSNRKNSQSESQLDFSFNEYQNPPQQQNIHEQQQNNLNTQKTPPLIPLTRKLINNQIYNQNQNQSLNLIKNQLQQQQLKNQIPMTPLLSKKETQLKSILKSPQVQQQNFYKKKENQTKNNTPYVQKQRKYNSVLKNRVSFNQQDDETQLKYSQLNPKLNNEENKQDQQQQLRKYHIKKEYSLEKNIKFAPANSQFLQQNLDSFKLPRKFNNSVNNILQPLQQEPFSLRTMSEINILKKINQPPKQPLTDRKKESSDQNKKEIISQNNVIRKIKSEYKKNAPLDIFQKQPQPYINILQ